MITNRKQAFARLYAACMDSSVYAFLASTGITETSKIVAINDLVINLKMYGLWNKMKAIYPFVSDTFNLLSYSQDFSNSTWTKNLCTIVANATTAPNGTNTASKLVVDTNLGAHRVTQAITTNASTYTFSIYAKAAELPAILIYNSTNSNGKLYNLSNGTLGSTLGTVTNSTITNAGNGWYRCTVTMLCTAASQTWMVYGSTDATSGYFFTGNGTDGVYLWGSQLEEASSSSTYQPITTTPAARFVSQFKYNLKDPRDLNAAFRLTFNGTWTYSQNGALPNGANAYAITYVNPTTEGFTQTDTHLSAYLRTDSNGAKIDIGGSYNLFLGVRWTNNYNFPINRPNNAVGTSANSIGYFLASRVDNIRDRMFKNGTNVTNFNGAAVSLDNNNINIAASSPPTLYSDRQTAFNTIGYGLTDTEVQNLYSCIQLFQTALNRYIGNPITKVSDVDAQTFVTSAGIYNQTQANAINTLVTDLKGYGIWSKMKAIYPFVSDTFNQFGYTEDFTYNAAWSQVRCSMVSNAAMAPNGTMTADSFTTTSTTIECQLRCTIASSYTNVTQTTSVYVKKSTANYFRIRNLMSGGNAWFNISNGTIGTVEGGQTATITSVGDGWYRCTLTGTKGTTTSDLYDIGFTDTNGTNQPTAAVTGFLWGAQLELGSTATTYQPVYDTVSNRFASQFKYNLKDPRDADAAFRLAFNGTWTYSSTGATPNGTNGYADTFLVPNTSLTTSSGHLSVYSRTNSGGAYYDMGSASGAGAVEHSLLARWTDDKFYAQYGTPTYPSIANTDSRGLFITNRNSTTNTTGFKNGIKVIDTAQTSSTLSTSKVAISATNVTGTISNYSNRQLAFASIGNGLSDTEAANLYIAVQKYQTSLNRNV